MLLICALPACFAAEFTYVQDTVASQPEQSIRYDRDGTITPISWDDSIIEQYKEDDNFNYEEIVEEETWWDDFKRWIAEVWHQLIESIFGNISPGPFLTFLTKVLPWMIVVGLLVFIVWVFYKLNPGARFFKSPEAPEVFFTEEEEIVKRKDIKKLISKALEAGDFRLAIRYYYLLILKKLTDAEVIDYEFDKTNSDYISEIQEENIQIQFIKVTTLYDYTWYGSFDVTRENYEKAERTFQKLETLIPESHE